MRAYKCDICDKFFTRLNGNAKFYITTSRTATGATLDLCSDCQKKLDDFVESNKKKQEEVEKEKAEERRMDLQPLKESFLDEDDEDEYFI